MSVYLKLKEESWFQEQQIFTKVITQYKYKTSATYTNLLCFKEGER